MNILNALETLEYLRIQRYRKQDEIDDIDEQVKEIKIKLAAHQPRYPESVLPPFGATIVAFEPDGTPHMMEVSETWAHQMFEQGYVEWAEIPGK